MKQLIVMIATVILGLAIAALVMGFKTPAQNITDSVTTKIESTMNGLTTGAGIN